MSMQEKHSQSGAFAFLCIVVFLTCFGLLMLYSASYDEALRHNLPHYYFFVHQLVFVLLSLVCGLVIFFLPIKVFRFLALPFVCVAFVLMLLSLFSPLGVEVLGARRWIRIGPLSLQPSEVAKVAMFFFLADWYSKEHAKPLRFLVPMGVMALFASLILLQRDFSTTIVFVALSLAMQLACGLGIAPLLLAIAIIAVPASLAIMTEPYRIQRIASFLFPGLDEGGLSYQVDTSLKAIRSGGLFGVGLGEGTYKLGLLPEVQNDFIFASMCEELGLVWMLFLLCIFFCFALLGYRSFLLLSRRDRFLAYLDFGITTMIVIQVVINISVVTGLLPPTGIPLPFFSQGGTNLFVTLVSCALMFRFMREIDFPSGKEDANVIPFPAKS